MAPLALCLAAQYLYRYFGNDHIPPRVTITVFRGVAASGNYVGQAGVKHIPLWFAHSVLDQL